LVKNNIFPGSSTDFLFEEGADFQHNQDGTGTITGILYNTNNPTDKWRVEFFMSEGRTWEEWSALGRSYKDEKNLAGEDPSQVSQLIGMEDNAGKTLEITHMPADYKYGFQLGVGANSKNADYGFAGWFFYSWDGVNYHQGDFNLDLSGCNTTTPDVTITASQETFSCNDLGEKSVTITSSDGENTCTETIIVSVEDNIAPVVVTKDITRTIGASGKVTIQPEDVLNFNCSTTGIYFR